jgi:hypothetical protein
MQTYQLKLQAEDGEDGDIVPPLNRFVHHKGVGPDTTLAWAGWKQPDILVEVDTDRLETSRTEAGVLKELSLASIDKLSHLKYS